MFRMKRLICAKFGKDLFHISKVIGRKKVAQFFWLTVYVIITLFIQQQNSTNTVTNVDANEVETGMTRLIALTVTPVY